MAFSLPFQKKKSKGERVELDARSANYLGCGGGVILPETKCFSVVKNNQ